MLVKCPRCKKYTVDFDDHFKRPRCFGSSCGWMPELFPLVASSAQLVFDVCDRCWGYKELQSSESPYVCSKCLSRGKVLNSIGEEVAELVRDIKDW